MSLCTDYSPEGFYLRRIAVRPSPGPELVSTSPIALGFKLFLLSDYASLTPGQENVSVAPPV